MIYFVQRGESGPVKIGYTVSLNKRMAALQNASAETLTLLRTIEGDRHSEQRLHQHFSDLRLKGEWFTYSDEMLTIDCPQHIPELTHHTESTLAHKVGAALVADFGHLKSMHGTIGEITGCDRATVKAWVAGKNAPGFHHLVNLAMASNAVLRVVLEAMGDTDADQQIFQREAIALLQRYAK